MSPSTTSSTNTSAASNAGTSVDDAAEDDAARVISPTRSAILALSFLALTPMYLAPSTPAQQMDYPLAVIPFLGIVGFLIAAIDEKDAFAPSLGVCASPAATRAASP